MKYVVTGGTGFLGRHLVSRLEAAGHTVAVPRSASCDLLQLEQVLDFLTRERPDRVVHSAAYYGGLGINVVEPATIYFRNITMGANLFEAARQVDSIRKVVVVGTACSYPGKLENLMREEDFWAGPVHGSVENYGLTKKIMSVQGRAYKTQYGLDSMHLVLTNLYGPWDSYNPHRSHVVAALVRKFVEASAPTHPRCGCGVPARRCASSSTSRTAPTRSSRRREAYDDLQHPLNIGTGIGTSIKELAETVRDLTRSAGELVWETDKPDGQAMKILDPTRARATLTWRPTHSLRDGLAKTIAWYDAHKAEADARW